MKFKVGDRVRVYHGMVEYNASIVGVCADGAIQISGDVGFFHPKQCRLLKPKKLGDRYPASINADMIIEHYKAKRDAKTQKKKVTKTIEAWVNIYPDGTVNIYRHKEIADMPFCQEGRIACVPLTASYEVEE